MKSVGIIAEFNPFHNGHRYLIEEAKKQTGADCCAIIMSGDFVQRGAPAICNKYLRTEMALKGGADIVFELPQVYALGSAEMFAEGAVGLLSVTGQMDYLCFGSECGDTEALKRSASIIEEYTLTPEFKEKLAGHIKSGESYPSAFSNSLGDALGSLMPLLCTPNNLLGIEYIRSLMRLKKSIKDIRLPKPLAIKRIGSDHFDTEISEYSSATSIRDFILNRFYPNGVYTETGKDDHGIPNGFLPDGSLKIITEKINRLLPITEDDFNIALYMRLNTMTDDELFSIPDVNPDLIHKLLNFKGKRVNISELIMSLKSKCFTYTAISRALFRILLCPAYTEAIRSITSDTYKPYLRLLGFNRNCSEFLRNLRNSEQVDVITKPADGPVSDPVYNLDIYASNLYEQICSVKFGSDFNEELRSGPVMC